MSLRRWPFSLERLAARRFSSLLLARFSSSSDVSCCCQHTDSTGSQHIPSHMLQSTDRTGSLRTPPYTSINRLHWLSADSLISHFSAQTTLALSVYQSIKRPHWLSVYLLVLFNQPATLALSVSPHALQSTGPTGFQCISSYISLNMPHWWQSAEYEHRLHNMRFFLMGRYRPVGRAPRSDRDSSVKLCSAEQQQKEKKKKADAILTGVRFLGAASSLSLCLSLPVCLSLPPSVNFRYTLAYRFRNSPGCAIACINIWQPYHGLDTRKYCTHRQERKDRACACGCCSRTH